MQPMGNPFKSIPIIVSTIFILVFLCLIPIFCLEDNTNFPGSDYKNFDLPNADPGLCEQACAGDPACQAFTYVKPGIQGPNARCWLKNSVPSAKSDSCCISGVKNAQPSGSQTPSEINALSSSSANILLSALPSSATSNQPQKTMVAGVLNPNLATGNKLNNPGKHEIAGINLQPMIPALSPTPPIVINFEDLSTTGPGEGGQVTVSNQYANKGITFSYPYPVALDYSKGPTPWRYQGFSHSGTKAIEQCYGQEFCTKTIGMNFTAGQTHIKVWVGYSDNLVNQKTVILSGFDSSGKQVQQVTATLQPSTAPMPINIPLEINSDSSNIYSATVDLADANGMIVPTSHLSVDDIEFSTSGPAPSCSSTQNPVVTLTQPASGQIVRKNSFNLQGTVSTTAPLESAKLI